jgi:parvulin-like peptidyl-prolyl isomerase
VRPRGQATDKKLPARAHREKHFLERYQNSQCEIFVLIYPHFRNSVTNSDSLYRLSLLLLLLTVTMAFAGCGSADSADNKQPTDNDTSPVIVEINGVPEKSSAFERFIKAHLSDFYPQTAQSQPGGSDDSRSRLFDEFVRRQVIVREAQKRGITASQDEVARAVQQQHRQSTTETSQQEQTTLTSSERTQEIVNELLTLKYYQTEVLKGVQVMPEEVKQYYEKNKSRWQKNGVYVREIRVDEKSAAEDLRQKVLARPADFAALARENSKAANAASGGLMFYAAGILPAVLEQEIMVLKVGNISRVVQSSYGYHIFRLEKRAEPQPFDKIKSRLEEELLARRNQELIDAYIERALSSAQIKIFHDRLGFTYSGKLRQA